MAFFNEPSDAKVSGKFMIDREQLQGLQDVYSQVANIFIFCVDEKGKRITEMSGDPEEMGRIVSLLDEMQIRAAINRVLFDSVEVFRAVSSGKPSLATPSPSSP